MSIEPPSLERIQACVKAMEGIEDPVAFVKAAYGAAESLEDLIDRGRDVVESDAGYDLAMFKKAQGDATPPENSSPS